MTQEVSGEQINSLAVQETSKKPAKIPGIKSHLLATRLFLATLVGVPGLAGCSFVNIDNVPDRQETRVVDRIQQQIGINDRKVNLNSNEVQAWQEKARHIDRVFSEALSQNIYQNQYAWLADADATSLANFARNHYGNVQRGSFDERFSTYYFTLPVYDDKLTVRASLTFFQEQNLSSYDLNIHGPGRLYEFEELDGLISNPGTDSRYSTRPQDLKKAAEFLYQVPPNADWIAGVTLYPNGTNSYWEMPHIRLGHQVSDGQKIGISMELFGDNYFRSKDDAFDLPRPEPKITRHPDWPTGQVINQ